MIHQLHRRGNSEFPFLRVHGAMLNAGAGDHGSIMQHGMLKHLPVNVVNKCISFTSLMFEDLRIEIKDLIPVRIRVIKTAIKADCENEDCISCQSTIGQSFAQPMIFVTWFSYFWYGTQPWGS